jgi:hypothetical protein
MMEYTPLDPSTLSPAAQKALGPGPGRLMASRGIVPLPPGDQVSVLYQLAIDKDQNLAMGARATATGLPDKVLSGALADARVDARVLDFFASLIGEKPAAFEALIGNASTADGTIAKLAELGGLNEVERIAANEQRLLRHPEIIAAMYKNKQARMSTIDRVVELAVRNHIRVPGLAAWDEIARALDGAPPPSAEADVAFALAAEEAASDDTAVTQGDAENAELVLAETGEAAKAQAEAQAEDEKRVPIEKLSVPAKIRLAILGNGFQRAVLVRDPLKIVSSAAIKSPGVTEFEAARYAGNPQLSDDVIRYIAGKREWTKLYGTKVALCRNPKTPVSDAMRLMPFLRDKDLVNMTKSKGIPSAVVAQARKLLMQRRGGDKK